MDGLELAQQLRKATSLLLGLAHDLKDAEPSLSQECRTHAIHCARLSARIVPMVVPTPDAWEQAGTALGRAMQINQRIKEWVE
jgi:hypothetical protein